jgi:hypothetical protein
MSDVLPKIVNGNFLKHLHHFCISDDQGFSFLVHNTIKLCQEQILTSDAAEEKLVQTSSYLQDCLSKQLFIEKHKVTGQNVDIYTFQMIKTEILQKQVSLFLAYSFKNHMMSLLRQFFSQTMH